MIEYMMWKPSVKCSLNDDDYDGNPIYVEAFIVYSIVSDVSPFSFLFLA